MRSKTLLSNTSKILNEFHVSQLVRRFSAVVFEGRGLPSREPIPGRSANSLPCLAVGFVRGSTGLAWILGLVKRIRPRVRQCDRPSKVNVGNSEIHCYLRTSRRTKVLFHPSMYDRVIAQINRQHGYDATIGDSSWTGTDIVLKSPPRLLERGHVVASQGSLNVVASDLCVPPHCLSISKLCRSGEEW